MLLLKKQYRLSLLLIAVFGVFLFFVDQTSEQIIRTITDLNFHYEKPAFLKLVYIVILAISLVLLLVLERSKNANDTEKGNAYLSFIIITVVAFFPGWIIHLIFVVNTINSHGSFFAMEQSFWFYNCADFTFVIGFIIGGIKKLRPTIHDLDNL